MEELERLIDTDVRSLDERVDEVLTRLGFDCVVRRFTYWYTGREPMHEARVLYAASSAA